MNKELENEIQELGEALADCKMSLQINPFELQEECRRHAEKSDIIAELSTRAKSIVRKAKVFLDYLESDTKTNIRKNPESFGITGKVTEGTITETLDIQKEVREARLSYIDMQKISEDFSNLVGEMSERKSMLRDLVKLHVSKYYDSHGLEGEEKQLEDLFEEDIAEQRNKGIERED